MVRMIWTKLKEKYGFDVSLQAWYIYLKGREIDLVVNVPSVIFHDQVSSNYDDIINHQKDSHIEYNFLTKTAQGLSKHYKAVELNWIS